VVRREPPRAGAPQGGGGAAGRGQRRLLHAARARQRRRRLGERSGGTCPCASARRGERAHLFDLARAAGTTARTRRRPTKPRVRPSVQHLLDAITGAPALVQNGRLDILAANPLARALYSEMYVDPLRPVNHARFVFLNPRAHDFYRDWERAANDTVAILRSEAGAEPARELDSDARRGGAGTRDRRSLTRAAAGSASVRARAGARRPARVTNAHSGRRWTPRGRRGTPAPPRQRNRRLSTRKATFGGVWRS
jgi:MmyB-like transcription regulator ligand binding domain